MDEILLEPLKAYTEYYEKTFEDNAREYFDNLVNASGIDVQANRDTVKKYNAENAAILKLNNKLNDGKRGRVTCILFAVLGVIALALGIYMTVTTGNFLWIISVGLGFVAAVISLCIVFCVLNPAIKKHAGEIGKRSGIAKALLETAWEQMNSLNCLFESGATKELIEKTVPKLAIDDIFDNRRYDYLNGKYGFKANTSSDTSTLNVLSGEILGNPFVVERELAESIGTKTYTGSIVIHWTTTFTDSQGRSRTQHHTQTLYASVEKPCPYYSERTSLVYGNEAAPKLSFTHEPTHAERYGESELNKFVKKGAKHIRKKQSKELARGASVFTEMGNADFDVLFNALDRDNEVEFRLLFTPLAQKNMLDLMLSKESFGDDFIFCKKGCLNYVSSEHSAEWDLDTDYRKYQSYDCDKSRDFFLDFNKRYFKALYFDLAPLLAIPLYQQHKPKEYIYKSLYETNYTQLEAECAVNKLGYKYFEPQNAATPSILKTGNVTKDGMTDETVVTAYAYTTEERVDYVTVFGGDGFFHEVPVYWLEYVPVSRESKVRLKRLKMSDKRFNDKRGEVEADRFLSGNGGIYGFYRQLLCSLSSDAESEIPFDAIADKIFSD